MSEKKSKSTKSKKSGIEIVFANALSPELKREYDEAVISASLKERVPANKQKELLKQFVEAGLMAP